MKNRFFYLAFTVDVTNHLNYLNLKLLNKSIPRLVNDISAFKIKINLLISPLKRKDFSKFPQLKEQSECAEDLDNFTEYTEKIINTRGLCELFM